VQGVRRQPDGSVLVDGDVTIRDLNRATDWELPDDEWVTAAGLVLHNAQTIPDPGQTFIFYNHRFQVLRRQRNQITELAHQPAFGDRALGRLNRQQDERPFSKEFAPVQEPVCRVQHCTQEVVTGLGPMIKALLIGGSAALVMGAVTGGIAQGSVGEVVSSSAGSRLDVASYAAPVEPTPWAEGDATAPYALPASVLLAPVAPAPAYEAVIWTPPARPELVETAQPAAPPQVEAATDATVAIADASEPVPEPAADLVPDPAPESLAPAPRPAPGLIVAGWEP
jgi:hypothetical protein